MTPLGIAEDGYDVALETYETYLLPSAYIRPMSGIIILVRPIAKGRYRVSPAIEIPATIVWDHWPMWIKIKN